jgi:hypothetical protein
MTKKKLQNLWLTPFIILILNNCSSIPQGPLINGCVIDVPNHGYQCSDALGQYFFQPFSKVSSFECFAPWDFETFLKKCVNNEKDTVLMDLSCTVFSEKQTCIYNADEISLEDMNNFFCMSLNDLKRTLDRCSNVSMQF